MTASIIIPVFGDKKYMDLSRRAYASAESQTIETQILCQWSPANHVSIVRNDLAKYSKADYLIFLDADDELSPNYVEEMLKVDADIIQPSTQFIHSTHTEPIALLPEKDLMKFNYLVVGSAIRRSVFEAIDGFRECDLYEDWDLFVRAYIEGATIGKAPNAVYTVHVNEQGRNNSMTDEQKQLYHGKMIEEYERLKQAHG